MKFQRLFETINESRPSFGPRKAYRNNEFYDWVTSVQAQEAKASELIKQMDQWRKNYFNIVQMERPERTKNFGKFVEGLRQLNKVKDNIEKSTLKIAEVIRKRDPELYSEFLHSEEAKQFDAYLKWLKDDVIDNFHRSTTQTPFHGLN